MKKIKAHITAVHGFVPEKKLTNQDLEKMVATSDQWITERTGIKERRILSSDRPSSSMGVEVAKGLCDQKNIDPMEIDLVLVATNTADYIFPGNANIISHQIGAKNAASFDMSVACSGFVYALSTASQFIETGKYKKIIVIGMDKMSSVIDYQDRNTCIIFGDGAAGVLLEPGDENWGVLDFELHSDGAGKELLYQPAGGSFKPASIETVQNREHFLKQDGKTVFKHAVHGMSQVTKKILEKNQCSISELDWLVPHQANSRIIHTVGEYLGFPIEKVMMNIEKYGNTTAATIPLCLWTYKDQLKKGDRLVLTSFGAGFTWGAVYVKWAF